MHGMKVNDSQYVHSTTLTLDISEVFFPLKRCTLEPVEKWWYFSDVIIIIYNINHTHHPPSDFFFFFNHLSVLLSILVSSSSFSPSHTPALYPSFLFPRLSRCHSALCLFPVSLCAQQSVKYCNPELRWSRPEIFCFRMFAQCGPGSSAPICDFVPSILMSAQMHRV